MAPAGPGRGLRWSLQTALALVAVGVTVFLAHHFAYRHYLTAGYGRAETVLRLTVNALEADLARHQVVPELIGDFDLIRELAADPDNAALRDQANQWLAEQNDDVQASDIYLILPDGETIAASNYLNDLSFVGQNFSYRPYFIEAMAGHPSRFYGVGTTSGVRGYFFSAPVRDDAGRVIAVVAVKIGVDRIEEGWRGGEYRVLVTDPEGLTFLSSEPGWRYRSLGPLTAERLTRSETVRRYAETDLSEFPLEHLVQHGMNILRMPDDPAQPDRNRRDYIQASQPMEEAGWTVHVLLDDAALRSEAQLVVFSVVLVIFAAFIGALLWHQRRTQAAERLALQEYATAELERRVTERTADLARVNSQLEQEISERRATEIELRNAQANLVQAGRLAALGQMSASLSHEMNQPLAAARNYADSAAILIERGEFAEARDNIAQILALVDRMAAIGKHLRQAARKPDEQRATTDLAVLLSETRIIVEARLAAARATLEADLPADLPPLGVGPTRLQQVLVNLITNAADAVEGVTDRRIRLTARVEGDEVVIRLRDHGHGIPETAMARIFDPFFTTKPMGAGMGLGLSISAGLISDMGGRIACRNLHPGVEFTLHLPAARQKGVAA
ncbi:sensor histidine kinase [Paracoccus sulfuroxidans]|uniref:C4-dicarboxylate transport sensor protein DctB n=1 Tax=Paracoccus sulfuroxidans TaxID=384678 RepID=A0A562NV72_9RHOB|nr:ATP-binding protein [Paracoccus sulfuroxidans]TWI35930.1 two-component system C4-dicarboxylate transport sensor histidine kinase DctB [Paracoccus sulfuroxidans]